MAIVKVKNWKLQAKLMKRGMKNYELANALGIRETEMSRIINRHDVPSEELKAKVCSILRVEHDDVWDYILDVKN